jgi:hypothetical protein
VIASIYVKPNPERPDVKVRDPRSKLHLAGPTRVLADDPFWLRRLRCGDVVLATAAEVAAIEKAPDAKPAKQPVKE